MAEFLGPQLDVRTVHCDNHRAVAKACRRLSLPRRKAPPGDSQSNGVIEALNRRTMAGATAHLIQAGLPCCFWPWAVQHWCTLRNTALRDDLPSSYFRRHGQEFTAERLPLGGGVLYYPVKTKYTHQSKVESRLSYGVFLGYVMDEGNIWTGMYAVADLDDFAHCSLDQLESYKAFKACRQPHCTEVLRLEPNGFRFPLWDRYRHQNDIRRTRNLP